MSAPGWSAELLSRIEDAGLNASAPPQQRWIDGWLVRFSPGKAQRARCINAVSAGRLALPQRLELCQALYRQAGLRMLFRITPYSLPSELDDWLERQGFESFDDTRVMAATLAATESFSAYPVPEKLQCEEVDLEAYAHIVGELRKTERSGRLAHAQRLLFSPVPYRGSVLRDQDGAVLACAQVAQEADMVGLYDVFTAPQARGQGLSRWLCAYLLTQAQAQGARVAYLQVDAKNHAARAVYLRLGFVDTYSYHYRAVPIDTR